MNGAHLLMESLTSQRVILKGNGIPQSLHQLEVDVYASIPGHDDEGSGKVRVSTITNQNWEPKGFHGNIIASNNQYLAYVLESRTGYVIRIIQLITKDRTLLKKFTGQVVDLSFAHNSSNMLAAIDEGGNLFVYDLDNAKGDISKISTTCLKLYIYRGDYPDGKTHRLIWCPYVCQEDADDHDVMIAASHGSRIEIFDLPEIAQRYASGISLDFTKIERGTTFINSAHSKSVTDMTFSPDCNVLATTSNDGHLKFWELNQDDCQETIKCLHDYQPHDGDPVTRLIFLDNHLTPDPNAQFWRFIVTGSYNNSIIKIWCTVKWKCLQTIKFLSPVCTTEAHPHILLSLDQSASYLLATDSVRSVLYVLPIRQDPSIGEASFSSITEYILTQPVLSFVLSGHTPLTEDSGDEEENDEPFNPKRNIVLLHLHCIQTRSMQKLVVTFEPPDLTGIPPINAQEDTPQLPINAPEEPTNVSLINAQTIPVQGSPPEENVLINASVNISSLDTSLKDISILDDVIVPAPMADTLINAQDDVDSVPLDTSISQYGPGQSSPAVKLLSPVSFLTPPTDFPTVLRSPSDFTLSSIVPPPPLSTTSAVSSTDCVSGLLITLPLSTPDSRSLEGEIVLSPSVSSPIDSFPSALNGIWNKDKEEEEEEWPALHDPIGEISVEDTQRERACQIVATVLRTAVATLNRQQDVSATSAVREEEEEDIEEGTSEGNQLLLQQLLDHVMRQQDQLESLRIQQEVKFEELTAQFHTCLQATHTSISNDVQDCLKEHNQKLEKLIKATDVKRNDKISQILSQAVQTNIAGRLEKCVKNETKNSIIPAVQKSFNVTQEGITRALNEQLTSTSSLINTHLHQILHAEGLAQSIANAVAGLIPRILPVVMETLFKTTLLPSFEHSCQQMFHQLDEAFRQGTSEYLSQLNEHQSHSHEADLIHQMTSSLQDLITSFNSTSSPVVHVIQNCIHSELGVLMPRLQESLKDVLLNNMRDELVALLDEKSSTQQQRHEERITQLVDKKEFDTAFNLTLSTSNLQLVMFLCHHISPEEVFDTNSQCPLSQPVLLSLIQQITVDLSEDVQLKVKYLEHAILSLDPADHVTSAHLPTVMQLLGDQLVKTEERLRTHNEGTATLFRAMKRVRMLSEHVCRSSSNYKT